MNTKYIDHTERKPRRRPYASIFPFNDLGVNESFIIKYYGNSIYNSSYVAEKRLNRKFKVNKLDLTHYRVTRIS